MTIGNEDRGPWVTVQDLAIVMNVSVEKVYRMARAGEIPAIRVGRAWRFAVPEVREALRPLPVDPWMLPNRRLRRNRL